MILLKSLQYILYAFSFSGFGLFSFFLSNVSLFVDDEESMPAVSHGFILVYFLVTLIVLIVQDISYCDLYINIRLSYASFASVVDNTEE